jgi:beta-glucanase (GH16 family)
VRLSARTRIARSTALGAVALLLLVVSVGRGHTAPDPVGHPGNWHLIFDDEFGGSRLDRSKWSTGWYGSGITGPVNPSEAQCYDPAQVTVAQGQLDLQLVSRTVRCSTSSGQITRPYVSGIVTTNGRFAFTHGYLEARVWMPGTRTIADWPAVWAVGHNWPSGGELDVVEGLGGQACWHFHDPSGAPGGCSRRRFRGGWHTFGANWRNGVVTWYYDGTKVGSVTSGITSDPMYLVLGLDVRDASYGGPILVPETLRIDYVRVWQP